MSEFGEALVLADGASFCEYKGAARCFGGGLTSIAGPFKGVPGSRGW